jgi:LysR family transcriptional regulator, glycine cleavage system transcriptional activator
MLSRLPSTTALMCFEAAARLGSFTRAALELHLTQAAVSRQVLGLEARLRTPLFLRRREALQLTAAGRAYLDELLPALRSLERATQGILAHQGRGGAVTLSVASSLGNHWLIPRLPAFTRAHPDVMLNIATRVGPADFSAATIDASLEYGDGQRPGLACEFLMPLQVWPHASPAWVRQHGRHLGPDTPTQQLIHHRTAPELWPRWFAQAKLPCPATAQGPQHDLMSMALNAALVGLGVALLPAYMGDEAVAAGRLLRLSARSVVAERGYWLVLPPHAAQRAGVQALRTWLLVQAEAWRSPARAQPEALKFTESTTGSNPRPGRRSPPAAPPPAPPKARQ